MPHQYWRSADSNHLLPDENMLKIINSIIQNKCHPALTNTFTQDTDGRLVNDATARIQIGGKRFSVVGKEVFNKKYFPD